MSTVQSPIISFIVPVYNVASYLRKCVDSLLAQDYDDYEIILVDDGSTDDSAAICDEYAKKHIADSSNNGRGADCFANVWGAHTADSTQYDLLKDNAIANRKTPTEAESILWGMLKSNNIGLHFRRQHIILDYIVDFICLEKGLVIELDGGYHNDPQQKEYDEQRTAHLQRLGYTELRFTNEELLVNPDGVIERIKAVAYSLPSLQGGAGGRPIIKVLHQKNSGLSSARNAGLAEARGKYVCFVDSDDFWQPNVLGRLIAQCEEEQLDVLRFDYQNVRLAADNQYEVFEPNKTPRYIDKCTDIVDGQTYLNTRMGYACYAVMFIIRRAILMTNEQSEISNHQCPISNHLFTVGLHFEDVEWLPRMMLNSQRVNSTSTIVYNYFHRPGSITKVQGDPNKLRKNIEDSMTIIATYQSYRKQYPDCLWLHRMQSSMAVGVLTSVARELYSERHNYIHRLRDLEVVPLAIADQGRTFVHRACLLNIVGPYLYCLIMHLRK